MLDETKKKNNLLFLSHNLPMGGTNSQYFTNEEEEKLKALMATSETASELVSFTRAFLDEEPSSYEMNQLKKIRQNHVDGLISLQESCDSVGKVLHLHKIHPIHGGNELPGFVNLEALFEEEQGVEEDTLHDLT